MPNLHSYSDVNSHEFFLKLADFDDMEIFNSRSIKALIDYKYPLCREFTVKILFMPFIFYLCTFIIYSNIFQGQYPKDTVHWERAEIALWVILYGMSFYFLFNECRQLLISGVDYLKSFWNYSDLLPPMLIMVVVSVHINERYNLDFVHSNFIYTVHSLASLLLWAKLIYFLRIFKATGKIYMILILLGYFVRILTDVVYEMKVFIFFLFTVYLGFGEAFLRFSEASQEDSQFVGDYASAFVYTFRLSMGDNDTTGFSNTTQPVALWIIWCIAAVLTNIVMLNLLVAIISEVFGRILENSGPASYQERARLIAENSYLIPERRKAMLEDLGKMIIVAMEVIEEDEEDKVKH